MQQKLVDFNEEVSIELVMKPIKRDY